LEKNPPEVAVEKAMRDANGTVLVDGDAVTLMKDLSVKGSSTALKRGTKVNSITILEDPVAGHDIAGKIKGTSYMLKSEFVKKA
jgi:protein PhnA